MPAYHTSINIAIQILANYEFVVLSALFACVWWLRNVNDEFNINQEIKRMSLTVYVCDLLYLSSLIFFYDTAFVVLGFCQYFQVILCLSLLFLTGLSIMKSYQPNQIVPFGLTKESIQ